jgi:hypothetical protein
MQLLDVLELRGRKVHVALGLAAVDFGWRSFAKFCPISSRRACASENLTVRDRERPSASAQHCSSGRAVNFVLNVVFYEWAKVGMGLMPWKMEGSY